MTPLNLWPCIQTRAAGARFQRNLILRLLWSGTTLLLSFLFTHFFFNSKDFKSSFCYPTKHRVIMILSYIPNVAGFSLFWCDHTPMQLTNQLWGKPAQCYTLVILCGDVILLGSTKKQYCYNRKLYKKWTDRAFSRVTLKLEGPMP